MIVLLGEVASLYTTMYLHVLRGTVLTNSRVGFLNVYGHFCNTYLVSLESTCTMYSCTCTCTAVHAHVVSCVIDAQVYISHVAMHVVRNRKRVLRS